jgi:SAM-dependent methyltransferase
VGRWSRLVARAFVSWLGIESDRRWLDVGCGTGELTRRIVSAAHPRAVVGIDPSAGFLTFAATRATAADRGRRLVATAGALPFAGASFDAVVSGLVLNFLPSPAASLAEMRRVVRPGGTIAAYVWDYADQMQMLRYFWDAAAVLDPAARDLDEGRRFPICQPSTLQELFVSAGLSRVETRAFDVSTRFSDFADYWTPFLGGQGPAPTYLGGLDQSRRAALRARLQGQLPTQADGSIQLNARAWAVRGVAVV